MNAPDFIDYLKDTLENSRKGLLTELSQVSGYSIPEIRAVLTLKSLATHTFIRDILQSLPIAQKRHVNRKGDPYITTVPCARGHRKRRPGSLACVACEQESLARAYREPLPLRVLKSLRREAYSYRELTSRLRCSKQKLDAALDELLDDGSITFSDLGYMLTAKGVSLLSINQSRCGDCPHRGEASCCGGVV